MDINRWVEIIGGVFAGGSGSWLLFKSAMAKNAAVDTSIVTSEARSDVIELLRAEVQRMSTSNAELSEALRQFQSENIALRKEISALHETTNQLSERLNAMQRKADALEQIAV